MNNRKSEKKNNVVLIGMPGVGKSTAGVILAKIIGFRFLDSDLIIQEEQGKRLREIIAEKGTDGFIAVENRINAQIQAKRCVIATGGSVVYGKEAMEHLQKIGVIVYLHQDLRSLRRRLHNIKGRGVVLRPGQTLEDIYRERTRLYRKYADIIIDEHGLDVEQTVSAIHNGLREYLDKQGKTFL